MRFVFWFASPFILALSTLLHAEVLEIPETGATAGNDGMQMQGDAMSENATTAPESQNLTTEPAELPESEQPMEAAPAPMESTQEEMDAATVPQEVAPGEVAPSTTAHVPMSMTLPGRGMLKDQVEQRFGDPSEKIPPVGEPPISRWVYPGYTVYFEYDHVIHSVRNR